MPKERRRFLSLQDRLVLYAKEVRDSAARLPPGDDRDALLKKARQADSAADVDEEKKSRRLRPPK